MSTLNYIQTGQHISQPKRKLSFANLLRQLGSILLLNTQLSQGSSNDKSRRISKELKQAGLSSFQLDRRESKHIASHLHDSEHIKAAVRGHMHNVGSVLIVATESRILYLHDIPLFSNFEEFPYEVVSGVSINQAMHLASITLFTKFKNYQVDYINSHQAEHFLSYVESQIYHPNLQNANNLKGVAPIR